MERNDAVCHLNDEEAARQNGEAGSPATVGSISLNSGREVTPDVTAVSPWDRILLEVCITAILAIQHHLFLPVLVSLRLPEFTQITSHTCFVSRPETLQSLQRSLSQSHSRLIVSSLTFRFPLVFPIAPQPPWTWMSKFLSWSASLRARQRSLVSTCSWQMAISTKPYNCSSKMAAPTWQVTQPPLPRLLPHRDKPVQATRRIPSILVTKTSQMTMTQRSLAIGQVINKQVAALKTMRPWQEDSKKRCMEVLNSLFEHL